MPIQQMDTTALRKMMVLTRVRRQQRISDDDIVEPLGQVESEDIIEHAFKESQRPRHAKPDQLDLTLHDVMNCLVVAQEEHRWIMASVVGLTQHLGIDHLPFRQMGPIVPASAHACHDGTGPPGTHLRDTDDDNSDEGMKYKEGEYESNDEQVDWFGLTLCILIFIFYDVFDALYVCFVLVFVYMVPILSFN